MSENTICNHCTLLNIRERAKKKGWRVTTLPGHGGLEVFVHPKDVKASKLVTESEKKRYFAAWFAELTMTCCC